MPGFLNLLCPGSQYVCVCVCVCVCVWMCVCLCVCMSSPEAINNIVRWILNLIKKLTNFADLNYFVPV